uniref:Utp12 domain-containing protein n=1 Tax=Strongyloides stercoralis TaxID=6248 RepID=A0A0K0DUA1_STRER
MFLGYMVRTRSAKYTEPEEGLISNGKQNGSLSIDNTYEKLNGKSPIKSGRKLKKNGTAELTMRELKNLNKKENIDEHQNGDLSSEDSVSSPLQLSAAASTSDSGSIVKEPTIKPSITDAANALASDSTNALSFAVSLTQSLLSSDSKKIDDILTRSISQREIKDTVKDLPTIHVIRLLKYIEEKLRESTGGHVEQLIRWSGIVISTHMSYLMTVSDLEKELGSFFSWIKNRVSHMETLFILNGKLRLLCEQIDKRCNVVSYADQKPSLVFHPDDESDNELEQISALEKEVFDAANEDDDWWKEDEEIQEKINVKAESTKKKSKAKKRHAEQKDYSDEDFEDSNQHMDVDDDNSVYDE